MNVKIKLLREGARMPERLKSHLARAIPIEMQEYIYQNMAKKTASSISHDLGLCAKTVQKYIIRFGGKEYLKRNIGYSTILKCPVCGREFRMKNYRIKKTKHNCCCSRECAAKYRSLWFRGENNHQYGLVGELNASHENSDIFKKNHKLIEDFVFVDINYPGSQENGRVRKHRYVVEQNYKLFNPDYFLHIGKYHVLKKGVVVHHIDGNHNNNELSNLMPMLRGEHTRLHNKIQKRTRNEKGQWI